MDPRVKKVLVVGCSSGVGLQVTKQLLANHERYEVFGLVRNEEKAVNAIGEEATKMKFIHGDITKRETLEPACRGVDVIVCSVGATEGWRLPGSESNTPKNVDYFGVKKLSEVAASAKVPCLVLVSSISVTRPWSPIAFMLNAMFGLVMHWKLKGENTLREAYKNQEGLSYNIVRPGGLTNKEGGKKEIIVDQGDKIGGQITRHDVGIVVLACVDGKCTPNATFEIVNGAKDGSLDVACLNMLTPDQA